jgi:hypothetical protein
LPYGIIIYRITDNSTHKFIDSDIEENIDMFSHFLEYSGIENIKPYLRSMSSMTSKEEEELRLLKNQLVDCDETNDEKFNEIISEIHNLYFSYHLDFMGLIPKGLALEAPEGMYNLKKK